MPKSLKQSRVSNSPLKTGESFKMCSDLCSVLGGSFETLPHVRGEFRMQAKTCHRPFLLNKLSPETLPCFRAKLGESLTLSPNSELSPDAGDSPSNARLWQWPTLLEFDELATPWLNVVEQIVQMVFCACIHLKSIDGGSMQLSRTTLN